MELLLVSLTQGRDAARSGKYAGGEALTQFTPGRGQYKVLHAAVGRMGLAFDQSAGLEAVDKAGNVGGIALEPCGQLSHRQRLINLQLAERHGLGRRELKLSGRGPERAVDSIERHPHQQSPHLVGKACIARWYGNTLVHSRIVLND